MMIQRHVNVSFLSPVGSEGFQIGYQRNNKTGGQKHLRCFPQCNVKHNNTGFCGSSVIVGVNFPTDMNEGSFHAFATFRCTDDPNEPANISPAKIAANANNGDAPLNPWYTGKLVSTASGEIKFEFNGDRRGWHYGWFATKSTREMFHLFKVYVYYTSDSKADENKLLDLVASCTSVPFQLCCTKRSKPDPSRKKRKSAQISSDGDDFYEERVNSALGGDGEFGDLSTSYPLFDFDSGAFGGESVFSTSSYSTTAPPAVPPPITKRLASSGAIGGSPALQFLPSGVPRNPYSVEERELHSLKRIKTLPPLDEYADTSDSNGDYSKLGGSPGLVDSFETTSSHGFSSPEHPDDFTSIAGDASGFNFLDAILMENENPFGMDDLVFEGAAAGGNAHHEMPDDMSQIWREHEVNRGVPLREEAMFDHHEISLPSDFSWERNISSGFYFNAGASASSAGFPSAPSYNKLPPKSVCSSVVTTPTPRPSESNYLSRLYDFVTGGNSRNGRSRSVSTSSFSDYHALHSSISTTSLLRPVRSGIAGVPFAINYPPAPTATHPKRGSNKPPNKDLVMPASSSHGRKSSPSSGGMNWSSFLSPLKVLLVVLSIAVGYLVVDKFQNDSSLSKGNNSYVTPSPNSGDLRTSVAPTQTPGGYLDGYIPGWLLQEFSSPKCQCGSFATLKDFCKLHSCRQNMLDSNAVLDATDFANNQYDLAKWVVTSKECLIEACDATSNDIICKTAGFTDGKAPNPTVAPTLSPVWSASYCLNVDWGSQSSLYGASSDSNLLLLVVGDEKANVKGLLR